VPGPASVTLLKKPSEHTPHVLIFPAIRLREEQLVHILFVVLVHGEDSYAITVLHGLVHTLHDDKTVLL